LWDKTVTKNIFLGLLLTTFCTLASAQDSGDSDKDRQYVTDQLRLSLYEEPNSQSKVLKLLQSGDMLTIDELRGPYALVTDSSGIRGWVKRGFLVTDPTSNILLREEKEKNASLSGEIEKLSSSKMVIDTYEKDMDELVAKMAILEDEKQKTQIAMDELQQELQSTQAQLEQRLQNKLPLREVLKDTLAAYWQIIAALLLLMLAVCFLVTKAIVEARIKSKFHGIKIW
jgi:SH3 domain protein